MALLTLTSRPEAYQFSQHALLDLRAALLEADKYTLITPITSPNDLILSSDTGLTNNGYIYSDVAFAQLCMMVAPGLQQLVQDLSGQWRAAGEEHRHYSGEQAVDIFNRSLRLRFDRKLIGMQLVRNTKHKTVDGVVGIRYRYLANSDFLKHVEQSHSGSHMTFLEGWLYGRELVTRFAASTEHTTGYMIGDEPYTYGSHCANTEVGGRSVRTGTMLVNSEGCCALGPFSESSGDRVVHSGKSFERRLHTMLSGITKRVPSASAVDKGGIALENKSLNLGSDLHEKNVKHLVSVLRRRKLNLGFSKRVVSRASTTGRGKGDALADRMPDERRLVLASRTGYDLFLALIREARLLPIDQREAAEQVAYALLMGKITY